MGTVWVMVVDRSHGGAAEEGQVSHDVGFAAARAILVPNRIAPPMVAVLHSRPVASDEVDPSFMGSFVLITLPAGMDEELFLVSLDLKEVFAAFLDDDPPQLALAVEWVGRHGLTFQGSRIRNDCA